MIFAAMAGAIKYFYDGKKELAAINKLLEEDKKALNLSLQSAVNESVQKIEALEARERSLTQDKRELENEYAKLLELKKSDTCYISWHDVLLPDSVSLLLQ